MGLVEMDEGGAEVGAGDAEEDAGYEAAVGQCAIFFEQHNVEEWLEADRGHGVVEGLGNFVLGHTWDQA